MTVSYISSFKTNANESARPLQVDYLKTDTNLCIKIDIPQIKGYI